MKKYYLPATWEVAGFHIIEADSLEQAQKIADDPELMEMQDLNCCAEPWTEGDIHDYAEDSSGIKVATPEEIRQDEDGRKEWELKSKAATMLDLITRAEAFLSGFEDDETQDGVPELLAEIRAARGEA